jgi:hypothetical protein
LFLLAAEPLVGAGRDVRLWGGCRADADAESMTKQIVILSGTLAGNRLRVGG